VELNTPSDIMTAAKEDYQRIMNFIAANVIPNAMLSACQLMRVIYEMPITEKQVIEIVEFQLAERKAKEL